MLSYYGWNAIAQKAPELLIVALILVVAYSLGVKYIERISAVKERQWQALTEFGKSSVDRFLRSAEQQALSMQRISDTFERQRAEQDGMARAIRAIADKLNEVHDMARELTERG